MRQQAKNDFEKDHFKLMNNAVFGKTVENVRDYVNVRVVSNPNLFLKLCASPRYEQSSVFSSDLVAVKLRKSVVKLNKPTYVGFSILDLSKYFMFEFHYCHAKEKYGESIKLLFTDTDSFCYRIKTNDVYLDIADDIHLYDTSDYPVDHFLHSNQNKKVLGRFKDETSGTPIKEFVGLRSKMYSLNIAKVEKNVRKGG